MNDVTTQLGTIPLYNRPFTSQEVEQLRLLLSTFCDGSGATNKAVSWTVPDYRDFERVVADVCGGHSPENKGIFDVYVPVPNRNPFGISCKMAGPGSPSDPDAAFIEMSNSSKKFTDAFRNAGISWKDEANIAGRVTVDLVQSWHHEVATECDLASSSFLLLTHSSNWRKFKLSSFPLDLSIANPETDIEWEVKNHRVTGHPNSLHGYYELRGKRHRVWELYPESGGQLKYRPLWEWANWKTDWFELEKPPITNLRNQARLYFPELWQD